MFVNWKRLLLAVYRIEENQRVIIAKLDDLERREQAPALQKDPEKRADEWLQEGINNIMNFQVGRKQGESE